MPLVIHSRFSASQLSSVPLSLRRGILDMNMAFKIIYGLLAHDLSQLINIYPDTRADVDRVITRRSVSRLTLSEPYFKTETFKHWFVARIPITWN